MADQLVSLCECWDLLEAQAIRASFQARGVFVHLDGEHHRSMMGMMGSAVALRVMVRSSQLELARELGSEIIPDLARAGDHDDDDEPGSEHSPLRRPPAEDLVDYRDDDDPPHDEADDDDDDDVPDLLAKKSIAVALVVFGLGLAVGTIHLYAGQRNQGLGLLAVGAFAFVSMVSGQTWALPLLAAVWIVDAAHGIHLLRERNRAIDERAKTKPFLN
jgi:hypothetical protein